MTSRINSRAIRSCRSGINSSLRSFLSTFLNINVIPLISPLELVIREIFTVFGLDHITIKILDLQQIFCLFDFIADYSA